MLQTLVTEPRDPSTAETNTRIAWLACEDQLHDGIYTTTGVAKRVAEKVLDPAAVDQAALRELAEVNAIALLKTCSRYPHVVAQISPEFLHQGRAGDLHLWVREKH